MLAAPCVGRWASQLNCNALVLGVVSNCAVHGCHYIFSSGDADSFSAARYGINLRPYSCRRCVKSYSGHVSLSKVKRLGECGVRSGAVISTDPAETNL